MNNNSGRATLLFAMLLLPSAPSAQVDPSGTWRTLHSQHFRIHFRPAYRAIAVEAAAEAERAYALLATELHRPRGIIDLTLADDVDAPNGFATTYPSNRFTVLLVPPVSDPALQVYDSWRRLVIVHELTHVFHLDRSRGLWKALQSVFGRAPGLFPNQYQPSWVVEGLATYYESRFTAGGRAEGSFHRQVVAADAAAGRARSPWDALLFTRWPDGLAPYAYGSRFWTHLARTSGDSIVPRFAEATAGQFIPFRVGRPLRRLGSPRALTGEWARAIADAAPQQPDGKTRSRLIAGALRTEPVPRVSPDGRRLAYVYDDGRGARRLRVTDAAGGGILGTRRVTGQVGYDWLGDTLVVAQLDFIDRWKMRSDLWRWTPDGAWRRFSTGARLTEPRAGGGMLATLVLGLGDNAPSLAGVPDPPGTTWGDVVPSPDGRWIVASRHRDGQWALVRWPTAAPESITVLAEPEGGVADPTWAGQRVLYVSDVAGFPQIHAWSEDAITQVTAEPFGARAPAPLPDGTVLFTTLGRDGWELRAVAPSARSVPSLPAALPSPFDSAPRVAVRETGYAAWPSLRPHFWIPLAVGAGAAGTFFGAVTAGADAVGRDAYVVIGQVSTKRGRAQGGAALVTHRLGNPTLDFLARGDWSDIGMTGAGRRVLRNDLEAGVGATFVTQRWRRFASVRIAAEYEGERFAVAPDTTVTVLCAGCVPRDFVGGSVTLTAGSAVTAPLTVSVQDGASVVLRYRRREQQGSTRHSDEVRGRLALYARLGPRIGFAYPVLAARVAAGIIGGSLSDRFSVGGVSSATVPFGPILSSRAFPVRGYEGETLRGRRAATVTAEYRLPLALVGKSLGHLPLGADKIALAVFGDVGDAWDPGQRARLHRLRSAGIELIGDLTVSYDLPLRVRVGVAQPATGHARLYAALAADF